MRLLSGAYKPLPGIKIGARETTLGNISLQLGAIQLDQAMKNLVGSTNIITYEVARTLVNIADDFFKYAQPLVPYETGLLRESARGSLFIGTQRGFGGYAVDVVTAMKPQVTRTLIGGVEDTPTERYSYSVNPIMEVHRGKVTRNRFMKKKGVGKLDLFLHYHRTGYFGTSSTESNVAEWTHEYLLPYAARPRKPAATKPGTGPKYMEIPWLARESIYRDWIIESIREGIIEGGKQSKVTKRGAQFTVDEVKLNVWGSF